MDFINKLPMIVIVDDEQEMINSIKRCLIRVNAQIETFTSPRLALDFIKTNQPTVVVSDQRMPDISGAEFLTETKALWPDSIRIMLSAHQDFDQIYAGFNQQIMNRFIPKPWNNKELIFVIEDAINSLVKPNIKKTVTNNIIGDSIAMQNLNKQISVAAGANVPIFIHGETGTGKELVANACHHLGCKKEGRFIAINCANFSETLIESQLYGHKKGAFTGAISNQEGLISQSNGGTLFLDEITTLPLNLQAKLLRVLQEREYTALGDTKTISFDSQIIAASSEKLSDAMHEGKFREDLYYRLNVIPLSIPPLREREHDIILLAEYFLKKFNVQHHKHFQYFSKNAEILISSYEWPGNVRQLENTIHSICIMNTGDFVTTSMVSSLLVDNTSTRKVEVFKNNTIEAQIKTTEAIVPLIQVERNAIENALNVCNGNITKAAALLEVNPSTIYRKIQKWETAE